MEERKWRNGGGDCCLKNKQSQKSSCMFDIDVVVIKSLLERGNGCFAIKNTASRRGNTVQ